MNKENDISKETFAKAREECQKSPSNCEECPFNENDKLIHCVNTMTEIVKEQTEEYNRKYHPFGGGVEV